MQETKNKQKKIECDTNEFLFNCKLSNIYSHLLSLFQGLVLFPFEHLKCNERRRLDENEISGQFQVKAI